MKKIRHFIVLFFFLFSSHIHSQDSVFSKNAIYIELLGNGGLGSLNYERLISGHIHFRIGYTSWSTSFFGSGSEFHGFPIMITGFTGQNASHFEAGGGILTGKLKESGWFDVNKSSAVLKLTFLFGYRYQKKGNGLLFRIGLMPFISMDDNILDFPMLSGGASIGYHF